MTPQKQCYDYHLKHIVLVIIDTFFPALSLHITVTGMINLASVECGVFYHFRMVGLSVKDVLEIQIT